MSNTKKTVETSLLEYGLILGVFYQIYQATYDAVIGTPVVAVWINLIIAIFLLLLLVLMRLKKTANTVAFLLHIFLLPAFVYFWFFNGGILGLVPFILCAYFGFIIATTNGLFKWISISLYTVALIILLFFPVVFGQVSATSLNLQSKPVDFFVIAVIIAIFTIYLKNEYLFFRKQTAIKEVQLRRIVQRLKNQNEELEDQEEQLKRYNENLEVMITDQTASIENRNRELAEYAFINAHLLRGPLSRILGLTALMETESGYQTTPEIIQIKELAVEMDKVVKKINEILH